jgi:hypothetical protein
MKQLYKKGRATVCPLPQQQAGIASTAMIGSRFIVPEWGRQVVLP